MYDVLEILATKYNISHIFICAALCDYTVVQCLLFRDCEWHPAQLLFSSIHMTAHINYYIYSGNIRKNTSIVTRKGVAKNRLCKLNKERKAVPNLNFLACKCVDFSSWISLKDYESIYDRYQLAPTTKLHCDVVQREKSDKLVDQFHVEYSLVTRTSLQLINITFDYLIEKLVRTIHNSVYKIEVKKDLNWRTMFI